MDHDHCVPHLTSNVPKYCNLLECNHHSRCRREFVLTSLSFEPDLAAAAYDFRVTRAGTSGGYEEW